MTDPTPEPTPAPTPAPAPAPMPNVQPFGKVAVGVGGGELFVTPVVNIVERGDRAEGTEADKAAAMGRMAGAVESANAQLLAALAQPVPTAAKTPVDVFLAALLHQLPVCANPDGEVKRSTAEGNARWVMEQYAAMLASTGT